MPQLNPAPWFAILMFSWLVFLALVPNKILNHTFTNELSPIGSQKLKSETWNWPWH